MNSNIANLYLALINIINSVTGEDGEPLIRFIDQDYGQLESHSGDMRVPVSWPCVLIDVAAASYTNTGEHVQLGTVTVSLRLGFPPYSGTSNLTDPTYRAKALYYYNLEQLLHQALHHKSPALIVESVDILEDVFGSFQRIAVKTEQRQDFIRVREITYTIAYEDNTTRRPLQYITPDITLSPDYTLPAPPPGA